MEQNTFPKLLTIEQLSHQLNIKRSTLYAWVARGKIPHVKIHKLIRFRPQEIETWVQGFQLEKSNLPSIKPKDNSGDVDLLIARAKREVYNARSGETRPISSPGKEGDDGAI